MAAKIKFPIIYEQLATSLPGVTGPTSEKL